MRDAVRHLLDQALTRLKDDGILSDIPAGRYNIERPREKKHGDFSTNAAMVLCKLARMKPRDLAQKIIDALPEADGVVEKIEIAGPGFINFYMTRAFLQGVVAKVRAAGEAYGRSDAGAGQKVQVEFVSANPTGPMHVGHGRGAVTGDGLARVLTAAGYDVEKEYYLNDAGAQMLVLGQSVLLRYRELFGRAIEIPEGCYPADYVIDIAQALKEADGEKWLETPTETPPQAVIDFAIGVVVDWIKGDLEAMNISFDSWFSEKTLHSGGAIDHALEVLQGKELLYEGVLEPPKGKLPDDWEPRPQLLFKASEFGDDVDRPLKKSNGAYTYFAADVAYHLNKAERGFTRLVNVWGADHGGYVKRVQAALQALTGEKKLLDVILVQMVNLSRGGEPVKMSKRAGTFVTLRDVVDEVGRDAVRFWFLTRQAGSQLDFDLELAVSQSNDNPVFYVQYAHARICSVWGRLKEKDFPESREDLEGADLSPLVEESELDLIRMLDLLPETVESAAASAEPHRLAFYLTDLASAFHTYYNGHKVLVDDAALRRARLALIEAARTVIANGLGILGVSAPERMDRA